MGRGKKVGAAGLSNSLMTGDADSSASEIDQAAEEMDALLGEVEATLRELTAIEDGDSRETKIEYVAGRMTRARNVLHGMKVELRDVPPSEEKRYREKVNGYQQDIQRWLGELNWAKSNSNKSSLISGAVKDNGDVSKLSSQQIIDKGGGIQDESMKSVMRSQQMVQNAQMMGTSTAEQLRNQTDQLGRIHEDVESMEAVLKLADAQIRSFMRKMATDKLILGFFFLIVAGIVTIIGLKIFGKIDPCDTADTSASVPAQIPGMPPPPPHKIANCAAKVTKCWTCETCASGYKPSTDSKSCIKG